MLLLALACTKTPAGDSGTDSGLAEECGGAGTIEMWSDVDRDGFGAGDATQACADDEMFAANADDCDDADAAVNPDATEVCNEVDDDCDGDIDEEMGAVFYEDRDDDGYGSDVTTEACTAPDGYTDETGDCDDGNGGVFPGADELCNDRDDDCDDEIDEDAVDGTAYYDDADLDGYGGTDTVELCDAPSWGGDVSDDCDDADPEVNPGADEVCGNGLDDDCDTEVDTNSAYFESSDGTLSNATADVTGTSDAPATPTFATDGDLVFCPGTYYVNATVESNLVVRSDDLDEDAVELNGALTGSVFEIATDAIEFSAEGLTFADGYGSGDAFTDFGYSATGGGISCYAEGTAVYVDGSTFREGLGDLGGGIASQGCDLYVADCTFDSNLADFGGALIADANEVEISDSTFTANEANNSGGALYAIGYFTTAEELITITDSTFDGNIAIEGAAMAIDAGAYVEMTGSTSGAASVTSNVSDAGAVTLFAYDSSQFWADTVSFGTVDGGDDNAPYDVANDSTGFAWMPEDDASFECDEIGCGEGVDYEIGSDAYNQESGADAFVAQIITADVPATLDAFAVYVEGVDDCTVDYYLLSASTPSTTSWTVEWSSTGNSETSDGWLDSGDIGLPVEAGTYYAVGAGASCDSPPDVFFDAASTEDGGFGDSEGYYIYDLDYATYSGTATVENFSSSVAFYTTVTVTEL
ncbi:MAG: hypothetical protein GY884_07955 [Proteobacteria bacterium]|nr:hypothetical protein [Pseudomonadota bacterium]